MNDFTKEELTQIGQSLRATSFTPWLNPMFKQEHLRLIDKIQSMIDNYCDHNYKKTLDRSGMSFISMCHHCKDSKPWGIADDNQ